MSLHPVHRFAAFALGAILLPSCAGCADATGPADENAARQALTEALDAWTSGGRPAELRRKSPEFIVVDQDWTDGCRLLDYELVGTGLFDGKNLRAPVTLTLQHRSWRGVKKINANFVVGLQPVITVVRVME